MMTKSYNRGEERLYRLYETPYPPTARRMLGGVRLIMLAFLSVGVPWASY